MCVCLVINERHGLMDCPDHRRDTMLRRHTHTKWGYRLLSNAHTRIHTRTHIHTHTHICKYMHTHSHAYIHRHVRTYTVHAFTHTVNLATHTHTQLTSISPLHQEESSQAHLSICYLMHVHTHTHKHTLLHLLHLVQLTESGEVSRGEHVTWVGRHHHHLISLLKFVIMRWEVSL